MQARQTGRAGEFLAAYHLQIAGADVYHVNASVDLIVMSASGRLLAVEVKAASKGRGIKRASYAFKIKRQRPDFYVFVALDLGRLAVMGSSEVHKRGTMRLYSEAFSEEAMQSGIARIIDA